MLFDDKTKGIAQAYLSMLGESHFKVGDKVKCKASGKTGTVTKLDKEDGDEDEKYYTVKQDSGKVMKYAPNELSKLNESKMDPVNPKAVKKKFDDRMDKDIDNDGDVDDSDEYLHKRRKAISKAVKKEAIEIEMQKKSKMNGSDDDDDDDEDMVAKGNDKMKVKKNSKKDDEEENMKESVEELDELSKETLKSYAKKAEKSADKITDKGHQHKDKAFSLLGKNKSKTFQKHYDKFADNLVKGAKRYSNVVKAKKRLAKEDLEWNWDAILEAPEEELDAMIEEMSDDDLESFVSEFESIQEGDNWYQASTNSVQPMRPDGRETLDPRASADRAFANAHRQNVNIKDYPGKDKPVTNAKSQAPARPGENRNPEPKKTLSDIRNKMK